MLFHIQHTVGVTSDGLGWVCRRAAFVVRGRKNDLNDWTFICLLQFVNSAIDILFIRLCC